MRSRTADPCRHAVLQGMQQGARQVSAAAAVGGGEQLWILIRDGSQIKDVQKHLADMELRQVGRVCR